MSDDGRLRRGQPPRRQHQRSSTPGQQQRRGRDLGVSRRPDAAPRSRLVGRRLGLGLEGHAARAHYCGDSINGHRRALVSPSTGPHAPDRFLSIENVRWRNQDFVQVFEFPTQVGHSKSQPDDGKPSLNGAWSESRAPFLNFTPPQIFL